ncbi:hypothetical protein [Thermomonas fusca]|uniref:hypothetical protein n=1 Tax=Thermomonas fusca TaxID=215690 RepID=UPI000402112E|nr:hypothetical protein [Thermomonas fusca]
MSKQEIRSHIAWLGRATEAARRLADKYDQAGDEAAAAHFHATAQRHAESAQEWAEVLA